MKTLREQFEDDYAPVSVPAADREGFKVKYVYYGPWYVWDMAEGKLKNKKRMLTGISVAGLAVYLFAGLQPSGANSFHMVETAGILALCAHVFELSGVFQFLFAKYRTSRMTFNQVNQLLLLAPVSRGLFLTIAGGGSLVYMGRHSLEYPALWAAAGYLACAGSAFFLFCQYKKIPVRTEKNETLDQMYRI